MGRKAKPVNLIDNKKHKKTKKEIEARKLSEPKIKSNELKCPEYLNHEEAYEWNRIVELYKEIDLDILNDLDLNVLEVCVRSIVTYKKCMKKVREHGPVIVYESGLQVKSQYWMVANQELKNIKSFSSILMLNPLARASMGANKAIENKNIEEDLKNDPMSKLLYLNPREL